MKNLLNSSIVLVLLALTSCVTNKKYATLESDYKKMESDFLKMKSNLNKLKEDEATCQDKLTNSDEKIKYIANENKELHEQVDFLKKNNTQALNTLSDLSVLSNQQAESVKKSLENLVAKEGYIMNLQSALARKDSLTKILVNNLKGAIGDINDKDINIKIEKGVVYIDVSDKLLFNSGSYVVTDNAKVVLGKVAKVLNSYPDIEFIVEGHTDTVPIHTDCMEDNWDLSVKRATSIVRILENQYHIDPVRMTASGHSKFIPVASNDNTEGRALNRRTRIIILPQLDQFFKLLAKNN